MPTRCNIVTEARTWIGTPYHHQASRKGIGCDCLGLVRGLWRTFYGPEPESVPPYSPDWAEMDPTETFASAAARHLVPCSVSDVRPGDVVLFRLAPGTPAKHAAVVSAGDRIIHAYEGSTVVESTLSRWWQRRLAFGFRFPGLCD